MSAGLGGGVAIRQVTKFYGSVEVLPELSVDVQPGEFIVFVGPSGCGKSTLLRMIAGLEAFQSGEISIDGRVVNALHPSERDIAMVFQDYALYPHMTVRRNMGFGLQMRGTAAAEVDTRVREAAATLQIEHLLERRPRELSGGQRQRVAMGRAIVRKPKVFLFDEPLSNLDAKLRVDMRSEIKALHQRLGTTSIYVTHDQVEAMTMADRIVVLNHGRIEQLGTPLALYHQPRTRFVAGFLGSPAMNFLPVQVDAEGVQLPGGGRLPIASAHEGAAELGIRPERLRVAASLPQAHLQGTVQALEPLGSDTLAMLDCAGHRLVMRLPGDSTVHQGQTLPLALDEANAVLFDIATGQRIGTQPRAGQGVHRGTDAAHASAHPRGS